MSPLKNLIQNIDLSRKCLARRERNWRFWRERFYKRERPVIRERDEWIVPQAMIFFSSGGGQLSLTLPTAIWPTVDAMQLSQNRLLSMRFLRETRSAYTILGLIIIGLFLCIYTYKNKIKVKKVLLILKLKRIRTVVLLTLFINLFVIGAKNIT